MPGVAGGTGPGALDGEGAPGDVEAPEPPGPGTTVAVRPATAPGPVVSRLHAGRPRPTTAANSTATVVAVARRVALTRSS